MEDWQYAQADRAEELAQLHYFAMNKNQNGKNVPFVITVKEFAVSPQGQHLRFFAEADKPVNQSKMCIRDSAESIRKCRTRQRIARS